jgi:hypothetical protein
VLLNGHQNDAQEFSVVRGLVLHLDRNQRWTLAAKVRKVLFPEKRREGKDSMGSCSRTQKLVVPWVRLEVGFYSFFIA